MEPSLTISKYLSLSIFEMPAFKILVFHPWFVYCSSFQRIIADSGSDKTLVDYAKKELPKYEKAVSNLVTLQGQCGTKKVILDPRIEEESDSNIRSAIPKDGTS